KGGVQCGVQSANVINGQVAIQFEHGGAHRAYDCARWPVGLQDHHNFSERPLLQRHIEFRAHVTFYPGAPDVTHYTHDGELLVLTTGRGDAVKALNLYVSSDGRFAVEITDGKGAINNDHGRSGVIVLFAKIPAVERHDTH